MLYTFDDAQQEEEFKQEQFDVSQVSSAASSLIDWNDKDKIERQIRMQLQHQRRHGDIFTQQIESSRSQLNSNSGLPRLSEYFGGITVESLDEAIQPDKKLNKLFMECFGMKLGPEEVLEDQHPQGQTKNQDKVAFSYSPRIFDQPPQNEAKSKSSQSKPLNEESQQQTKRAAPQNTKQLSQQKAPLHHEALVKDVIVQQNTVNNDQSCQIIVNFYNVKCQSPPPDGKIQYSSSRTPCAHQMTSQNQNIGGSSGNQSMPIPVNKSRLSRILNSQHSVNIAEFKNSTSPQNNITSNMQMGGLQSLALSAQEKKNGSNPLTIEDQQMIFDSEERNSRPSDDCQNLSVPGKFKLHRVTPKQAGSKQINQSQGAHMLVNDSHPNFGSILEKKQDQSHYCSFDQQNSLPANQSSQAVQKAKQQMTTSQSLQKQLHQTTKQFFKSILYKNKHLSTAINQKKASKQEHNYSPPDDLKIQSIYNSLQNKKKSAPGYHSGSSSSMAFNHDGASKQKKLELIDVSKYNSNEGKSIFLPPHSDQNQSTHQKMQTGSSGTLYTSTNNDSMESLPIRIAQSHAAKQARMQVKAQKIGSIISMKALRNELMSQGIYSNVAMSNLSNRPSNNTTYQRLPVQLNVHTTKQRLQSRNYALLPANQYTEVVRRHFKSTEETSFSPTLGEHVIKLEAQNSSRNRLAYHNTHSHQSSIKSINEEEAKSSVGGGGENRSKSRFLTQYSDTRVGSPKFSIKRQVYHKKRLNISPSNMNHILASQHSESRQESYRRFGSGDHVTQNSNLRTSPRVIKSQKQKYVGASQNLKHVLDKVNKDRKNSEINISAAAALPHKRYLSPGMTKMNSLNEQKFQEIQKVYASKHNKLPLALSSQFQKVSLSQSTLHQVLGSTKAQKQSMQKSVNKMAIAAPPRMPARNISKEANTAKNTFRKSSKESVTEQTAGARLYTSTNKHSSQSRKQIPFPQSAQDAQQIHVKVINQFKPSEAKRQQPLNSQLITSQVERSVKGSQNQSYSNSTMINQTINNEKSQERQTKVKYGSALGQSQSIIHHQGLSRQNLLQTQLSGGSIADSLKKTLKNVQALQSATRQ